MKVSKILDSNYIKYFLFYYRRLTYRIPVLLTIKAFIAFIDGLGLALFVPIFQIAEAGDSSGESLGNLAFLVDFFNKAGIKLSVNNLLLFMLGLFFLKGAINYAASLYYARIRVNFVKETRINLIDGICKVSYPGFVNIDLGRLQNIITTEIYKAIGAFSSFISTLQYGIMVLGYLFLTFLSNFQFAFLVTIAGLLSNLIFRIINKKVETTSLRQSVAGHDLQGKSLETIWNYKYLKATDLISNYRTKLVYVINEIMKLSWRMGKLSAFASSIREPIMLFFICAIIFIQVNFMNVSIMSIALSLILFLRTLSCLLSVQSNWLGFLADSGGIHTISGLSDEFEENIESKIDNKIDDIKESIQFENVTFAYAPHLPEVLNNINLTIKKHQTIAFVGESGSGKTTLVNMLAGLLMPVSGQIKIDGIPLTNNLVKSFRQHLGYITQEPVVFNTSLFNNITFHDPKNESTIKKFQEALEKTALISMVEKLPQKEDSLLGDNGVLISGGQKQRVSIARELYRDCSLLIMDEATSALDTENELIIQANINNLKGKYTIVIIAHRLSTVKSADIIYLLDKGKIEAYGNFEELKNKSVKFKRMVELQEF